MPTLRALRPWFLGFSILAIGAACQPRQVSLHGNPYPNPRPAPDFSLMDHRGNPFRISDHRGDVLLLFFGYTQCPDVCPATLGEMQWVFNQLGESSEHAIFGFVTVDPMRDTPEALASYMERFHPRFLGLWAPQETLGSIQEDYGIFAAIDPESDPEQYLVTHTARIFLIDPEGRLRTAYSFGTEPELILADLKAILGER